MIRTFLSHRCLAAVVLLVAVARTAAAAESIELIGVSGPEYADSIGRQISEFFEDHHEPGEI